MNVNSCHTYLTSVRKVDVPAVFDVLLATSTFYAMALTVKFGSWRSRRGVDVQKGTWRWRSTFMQRGPDLYCWQAAIRLWLSYLFHKILHIFGNIININLSKRQLITQIHINKIEVWIDSSQKMILFTTLISHHFSGRRILRANPMQTATQAQQR